MIIHNPPNATPQYSIILLHGLGADGSDFTPIIPELHLPPELAVRFVFPNAPMMAVTLNHGYVMRSWFDIYGITVADKIDIEGINQSVNRIHQLILQEEALGIPSEHIILAGFSQGAVIALHAGLRYSKPLAGIIALSGYLPASEALWEQCALQNKNIPIFLAHGTEDATVAYALGKASYAALIDAGYHVDWHSYPMAHTVNSNEISDISQWIQKVICAQSLCNGTV